MMLNYKSRKTGCLASKTQSWIHLEERPKVSY